MAVCETKFFQPSAYAGENLMAAGKNKKNGHIWYDLVRFSAIWPYSLVFFCPLAGLARISPDWAGARPD
jgi:hypothetical protein